MGLSQEYEGFLTVGFSVGWPYLRLIATNLRKPSQKPSGASFDI